MNDEETARVLDKICNRSALFRKQPVSRLNGGQTNDVFLIGESFIVKIDGGLGVVEHQPELIELSLKAGAAVPRILDHGKIDKTAFLVMERLPGERLSRAWQGFATSEKDSLTEQLAVQLQIFHSIAFEYYSPQRPHEVANLQEFTKFTTDFSMVPASMTDKLVEIKFDQLHTFYKAHQFLLNEVDTAVLVHNDIHFDNILYGNGRITGILDFDLSRQAPKDYELWHILDRALEDIGTAEAARFIRLLAKHYHELFSVQCLVDRLRLHLLHHLLGYLHEGRTETFRNKVSFYFDSDGLPGLLP